MDHDDNPCAGCDGLGLCCPPILRPVADRPGAVAATTYTNGWEAVRLSGWCIQCFTRPRLADGSMCADCKESRNQRSRNRNDKRPGSRVRRVTQAERILTLEG